MYCNLSWTLWLLSVSNNSKTAQREKAVGPLALLPQNGRAPSHSLSIRDPQFSFKLWPQFVRRLSSIQTVRTTLLGLSDWEQQRTHIEDKQSQGEKEELRSPALLTCLPGQGRRKIQREHTNKTACKQTDNHSLSQRSEVNTKQASVARSWKTLSQSSVKKINWRWMGSEEAPCTSTAFPSPLDNILRMRETNTLCLPFFFFPARTHRSKRWLIKRQKARKDKELTNKEEGWDPRAHRQKDRQTDIHTINQKDTNDNWHEKHTDIINF